MYLLPLGVSGSIGPTKSSPTFEKGKPGLVGKFSMFLFNF